MSQRGRSVRNRSSFIHDKDFIVEARLFVKSNACKPNLTSEMFCDWVNKEFSETICTRTWLHRLGFSQKKSP